jgi:uncharacterized membrane protein (UPF0127 family)
MRTWHIWVLVASLACQERATAAPPTSVTPPAATSPDSSPALPHGRVTFQNKAGASVFDVELALDEATHERGLMFRKQVPEGTGMLFVFPEEGPRVFWMKNTLIPLDMVFLSASRKIVGIIENTEPLTTSPRDSHAAAKYVLELAGGTAFAKGIHVGDVAIFDGVP